MTAYSTTSTAMPSTTMVPTTAMKCTIMGPAIVMQYTTTMPATTPVPTTAVIWPILDENKFHYFRIAFSNEYNLLVPVHVRHKIHHNIRHLSHSNHYPHNNYLQLQLDHNIADRCQDNRCHQHSIARNIHHLDNQS